MIGAHESVHDERAARLLAHQTLEEKAALTAGHNVWYLPRIDRLGIRALKMSDGPSGVRGAQTGTRRSLAFPCGMATGATWDPDLVRRMGEAFGDEARSKDVQVVLGPTVCIARTPLAGRTFESYAEDPHLSARIAVAWIGGVQSRGVGCCVKHFACNDQEHERTTVSAEVDERTLREVHLPSFEAAVREAGVWAVMSAYNRVNGVYCGEHPRLLGEVLKSEWGFDGAVISDWGGTHSTVEAALAGLDIEMPGRPRHLGPRLAEAVEAGDVPAAALDDHATRVLRLMSRTGVLDAPAPPDEREDDDPARRAIAREVAIAGSALLKNDGLLPLDGFRTKRIAVIGPNAAQIAIGGGGSSAVYPHRYVSFINELRARLGDVVVVHEPGCALGDGLSPMPPRLLDGAVRLEYFANPEFEGEPSGGDTIGQGQVVSAGPPVRHVPVVATSVRARGVFTPDASGTWQLGVASAGTARLLLDGTAVAESTDEATGTFFLGMGSGPMAHAVDLEAGRTYALTVELRGSASLPGAGFALHARRPLGADPIGRAVEAARDADCAIIVVGASAETESEGFDRPDLRLPGAQDALVRRVIEANPRTAVVLNCGSPVELPWADRAAAILMLWYPGEEGASALADMLTGASEPAGRLPITFPERIEDTPAHGAYYPGSDGEVVYGEGLFVGYRHYDARGIAPRLPFGHGLSYTTFELGAPTVDKDGLRVRVSVPVTNTGARRGSEVVQLYVGDAEASVPRPNKELRAFARVTLVPGATATAALELDERSFAFWDEATHGWKTEPGAFDLHIGVSSAIIRHVVRIERA